MNGILAAGTASVSSGETFAFWVIAPLTVLGALGMLLGHVAARAFGLSGPQRRAVALETGIQNSPLCFAILVTTFPGESQVEMLKLPLLYALFVLVEASLVTLVCRVLDARAGAPEAGAADSAIAS